jgi:hypothetical protein
MTLELLSAAIDSQFSSAARPGPIAEESPLAAIGLFSYLCRWNAQTNRIECGDIEWISMEMLVRGQRSNPDVQELYRKYRNSLPSRWDFWLLVVRSCGSRSPNQDEAQVRMIYQAQNNHDTIRSSQWAWKAAKQIPDPETKKFFQILSMYYLLLGQRQSADTMQLYRACFKNDATELFRRVEMITPLDIEDIVIELDSARKPRAPATP